MNYMKEKVLEFHEVYECAIADKPKLPEQSLRDTRQRILDEEWEEYKRAEKDNDLTEIADALGDMLYIIFGTCIAYGIPIEDVFDEIHNSNMSKLEDGKILKREDGKVLKGKNYFRPNIKKILEKYGHKE